MMLSSINKKQFFIGHFAFYLLFIFSCVSSGNYNTSSLPSWVLAPPEGGISATGSAKIGPAGLVFAKLEATVNARDEIARTLNVRLKNMIKNFTESTGVGDDQTVDRVFTKVSKQVAKIDFSGSVVKKAEVVDSTLYVLVVLPPEVVSQVASVINTAVVTSFKNDRRLWQKFQAKRGHNELKKEIEKEFGDYNPNVKIAYTQPRKKSPGYQTKSIQDKNIAAKSAIKRKTAQRPNAVKKIKKSSTPVIVIKSPVITGSEYSQQGKSIYISGRVDDGNGVAEVLINGREAYLDSDGNFSTNQLLRVGKNRVTITATNLDNIQTEKTLVLNREPKQKPQRIVPETLNSDIVQSTPGKWYKKQYALVVGINNYSNPNIQRLYNATNDSSSMYKIFQKAGYEAILLQNEQATKKNITKTIRKLNRKMMPSDSFVFYFAGHGHGITLQNKERVGYIIPYDAEITLESDDPIDLDQEAISIQNLKKYSKNIKAKHVALLLDSCFAGLAMKRSIRRVTNYDFDYYNDLLSRKSINILTAGDDQPVSDGYSSHSQFTQALIDALELKSVDMEDRDGFATFNELAVYVKAKVEKMTGRRQRPQFDNLSFQDGDYIFKLNK